MKFKNTIQKNMQANKGLFAVWCILASFGAYFSMYAFRKPFNAGTYEGLVLLGIGLKSLFIISQVIGYMLSKFIGIKIISELRPQQRVLAISVIIGIAYVALFLFAVVPVPAKPICLFINGLPLGMVWGIVFSFLEGRKVTELIATGLALSIIISSGFLKSISRWLINDQGVTEFWMPFTVASLFLPLFFIFVWMLSVIPAPSKEDTLLRNKREPMNNTDKLLLLKNYGTGIVLLVVTYMMLVICRDFRDNFAVEIWKQLGVTDNAIYTQSELPIGLSIVLLLTFLISVKDNLTALFITHYCILIGLVLLGLSTLLFNFQLISPTLWMLLLGMGMYLAYMPFQCVLFERFFATFKVKGNAGFLMYICDSSGYLGSVAIILIKEFSFKSISWIYFIQTMSYTISTLGTLAIIVSIIYFKQKKSPVETEVLQLQTY